MTATRDCTALIAMKMATKTGMRSRNQPVAVVVPSWGPNIRPRPTKRITGTTTVKPNPIGSRTKIFISSHVSAVSPLITGIAVIAPLLSNRPSGQREEYVFQS